MSAAYRERVYVLAGTTVIAGHIIEGPEGREVASLPAYAEALATLAIDGLACPPGLEIAATGRSYARPTLRTVE